MTPFKRHCSLLVIGSFLVASVARGEAVSDRSSAISPKHMPGAGEFVHGQGYGKLLVRLLIFGSVPVQGIHYVPEGTDLVFAIMYAGGYGEFSNLDGITIRRRNVPDLIDVDLEDLIEDGKTIPKMADGDIVTVPFNWRKDFQTVLTITGFVSSLTGFALSLVALSRTGNSTP